MALSHTSDEIAEWTEAALSGAEFLHEVEIWRVVDRECLARLHRTVVVRETASVGHVAPKHIEALRGPVARVHANADPLEWVRRITNQVPDARMQLTRFYGASSNRARRLYRPEEAVAPSLAVDQEQLPKSRGSWARLLRMVFEVDPLACPRCGAALTIVTVITTPAVVDKILRHLRQTRQNLRFRASENIWKADWRARRFQAEAEQNTIP